MRRLLTGIALAVAILLPVPASAQSDGLQIDNVDDADYPKVELTVAVPPQLADVALPADAFNVSEDGESRGRPTLGQAPGIAEPPAPRTVLAIDVSGSMKLQIDRAKSAAADFVRSLRAGSEVAVVTFGDRPEVIAELTTNVGSVLDSIDSITVVDDAETALWDGVNRANRVLAGGSDDAPKSIVVLSDGADTVSSSSPQDAVGTLEDTGTTTWAVALEGTDKDNPEALATLTGSPDRVLSAASADELQGIYVALASDVSRQYVLRYDSETNGETEIGVTVDYGTVTASNTLGATIDGVVPPKPPEVTRVASPNPFTVTVPLLGTTIAYGLALGALALAAVMLTWVLAARPAATTSRYRLLPASGSSERPGLTVVAEWFTDQADRRLRGRDLGGSIDRALEGAGLDMRTGELVVGVMSFMLVAYAIGLTIANPVVGIILALLVPFSTRLVLSIRRDRRQAAFAEQFIDVLQLLAGSLRAGYGLLQGIDAVANDAQDPASSEFRRILLEHRLGRDLTEAMDNCADRMANADFRWVVQAISIHREVGGDLARVLDNIVGTVRERSAVQRQVRALSAEGRMSAIVLTALPFVTALVISIASPGYLAELTSRTIGVVLLGMAGAMLLIGMVVIRRLVKIEY